MQYSLGIMEERQMYDIREDLSVLPEDLSVLPEDLSELCEEIRWIIAEFLGEYHMISQEYIMGELNRPYNGMIRSLQTSDNNTILQQRLLHPFNLRSMLGLKEAMSYIDDRSKPFPRQRSYNRSNTLKISHMNTMNISELLEYERERVSIIRSILEDGCIHDIRLNDTAISLFINALEGNISFVIYHIHGWTDIDVESYQIDRLIEGIDPSQAYKVDLMRRRVTFKYDQEDRFNFMLSMTLIDALIQQ